MVEDKIGVIHDPLYGPIGYTSSDLKLFQTNEFSRLRQVSLSAVPPWTIPTATFASRAEHSIGVMHLADLVTQKPEFQDLKNLKFAALAHDIASPPFSHLSEGFLVKLLGRNHEQYVGKVLDGSQFAKEVKNQGGDIDQVVKLINGENKPVSDLMNGSIDLDNIDNSLRYGLSGGILEKQIWDGKNPSLELAKGYSMEDGNLLLKTWSGYVDYWDRVRRDVYKFVYSDDNLSAGMMVWRAIYFAVNSHQIKDDFFRYSDPEAYDYLKFVCNPRAADLMERVGKWKRYKNIYDYSSESLNPDAEYLFRDPWQRGEISDLLSGELKIDPVDIAVYFGKNKGFKKIHLPIYSLNGDMIELESSSKERWMSKVFVNPNIRVRTRAVKDFMNDQLRIKG